VQNVREVVVTNRTELLSTMADGVQRRHVASTKMNSDSSRSHLLLSMIVAAKDPTTGRKSMGKITLCDLAGSERTKKSGAEGHHMKEAIAINKSLTALGDVIEALTTGAKAVPYRNHKLTQLMSDSLGGNAKTLMFVNVSPATSNQAETLSSLMYATRAKQITNQAQKSEESAELSRLKQVITMLSKQLKERDADGATHSVAPR